jgi:hypothetical protein
VGTIFIRVTVSAGGLHVAHGAPIRGRGEGVVTSPPAEEKEQLGGCIVFNVPVKECVLSTS